MPTHEREIIPSVQKAIELAEKIQKNALEQRTSDDRRMQALMSDFLKDPLDKYRFIKIIDQGLRPRSYGRVAARVAELIRLNGVPRFLSFFDSLLVMIFVRLGRFFPIFSVPLLFRRIRRETRHMVLRGEEKFLRRHLEIRKTEGVRININHLGEMVLGEKEAQHRYEQYLEDLKREDIGYVSVKISAVLSQAQPLAFEENCRALEERLTGLYRAALENGKYVNLDMEAYRDVELTATAFMRTLERPEFLHLTAGIALQSYIPDSFAWQKSITQWAMKRVERGGSPVKVRLVKGANLETEMVESSLRNWEVPVFSSKKEVDACYKLMLEYAMEPEHLKAVHLGIASHNIFDLAYAHVLACERDALKFIMYEMLEGMADHVRKAVEQVVDVDRRFPEEGCLLLYAPVVEEKNFINAMAYLIRRMDENTAEENFLRHSFNLEVGSDEWEFLKNQFIESFEIKENLALEERRNQDRSAEEAHPEDIGVRDTFGNEVDTDWSLPSSRKWAESIREKWKFSEGADPVKIPLVLDGKEIYEGREVVETIDRSQLPLEITVARSVMAAKEDADRAVEVARYDPDGWRKLSHSERREYLAGVAGELRKNRGDFIGAMAANTGKVFTESDVEVSEAIDFAEFYPWSAGLLDLYPNITAAGKGTGVVIPPWNFPLAIPAGGIIAALAAGNTVIMKPATDSVLVAWLLCQCFWRAGISQRTLQFLPCRGSSTGAYLAAHPGVDFIIFTGGTDTALEIMQSRPERYLAAETGGKNATIVTAMADFDSAINNIVHSAFSNCGQKCSATSLLILEREVFHDEQFRDQLVDAVRSYRAGSAWDFRNRMGPMIRPPAGYLQRALTSLEPGESWLIEPEQVGDNPYLWRPSIKWNVRRGSHCHMNELFGPVLSVMEAKDLSDAIEIVNSTGYGLTSGLESLHELEQEVWKESIRAGNLYINRVTTGAIVLRQPFGGMGKSAIGAGIKAGGPNYVFQFMDFTGKDRPEMGEIHLHHPLRDTAENLQKRTGEEKFQSFRVDIERAVIAVESYLCQMENEFMMPRDYFHLRGQDNIVRYLPMERVVVRVDESDSLFSILARIAAARIAGSAVTVSLPPRLENDASNFLQGEEGLEWIGDGDILRQDDEEITAIMEEMDVLRYGSPAAVPRSVLERGGELGFHVSSSVPLEEGRLELLHYMREQSISHTWHRYGNLGVRGLEKED